ncbi:MAG: hypothetical protein QOG74_2618 [Alphaproteobacteria bacterium]|nr:hypothetical protein [Alphaproteobacteria bacterium]
MNSKILPIVAACGLLLGSSALVHAQQAGQRGDSSRGATSVHKVEKRGDIRGQGGASGAASRQKAARDSGDKTTGSGSHAGDDAFTDDRAGHREGRLRGDRGADMMDNVRRVDDEPSD